jgi:hypothetical protein
LSIVHCLAHQASTLSMSCTPGWMWRFGIAESCPKPSPPSKHLARRFSSMLLLGAATWCSFAQLNGCENCPSQLDEGWRRRADGDLGFQIAKALLITTSPAIPGWCDTEVVGVLGDPTKPGPNLQSAQGRDAYRPEELPVKSRPIGRMRDTRSESTESVEHSAAEFGLSGIERQMKGGAWTQENTGFSERVRMHEEFRG